jgi:hypothetical protein
MIIHFCINAFSVIRSYGYQYPDSIANSINNIFAAIPAALLYLTAGIMVYFMIKTVKTLDADAPVDMKAVGKREPLKNYAFIAGAAAFGSLTTVFTFVWGVIR